MNRNSHEFDPQEQERLARLAANQLQRDTFFFNLGLICGAAACAVFSLLLFVVLR